MRNFMSQYASQLVFVARGIDKTGVDADIPTGQGEGIDPGIINDKERELMIPVVGLRGDAVAYFVDVLGDLRIFDELPAHTNASHDGPPDLGFLRLIEDRIGRAAHIRDLDIVRACTADEYDSRYSEQRERAFDEITNQQKISKLQDPTNGTLFLSVCSTF